MTIRSDATPYRSRALGGTLSRWASVITTRNPRPRAARRRRALPLHDALAIGLGCNVGTVERYTGSEDTATAGAAGNGR